MLPKVVANDNQSHVVTKKVVTIWLISTSVSWKILFTIENHGSRQV